ncbi:MAG: type II secretion system protein GspE [Planctomycetales bacterium]|nr:type II secretion system protein GspE [Planctomycetales bacterium]
MLLEAALPAPVVPFPFSIWKLALLLAWFYLGLDQVQRLDRSSTVSPRYRPLLQIAALAAGPLVLLVRLGIYAAGQHRPAAGSADQRSVTGSSRNRVAGWLSELFGGLDQPPVPPPIQRRPDAAPGAGNAEADAPAATDTHIPESISGLIDDALRQRASDILIDPQDPSSYAVRLRVDGTLRSLRDLPLANGRAVINSIKALAGMDIAERRRPQDGAFIAKKGQVEYAFRVASSGSQHGEKLTVRVRNQAVADFTLEDAGFSQHQRSLIADALARPSGLVLVCGLAGSGKTTTLYAMLNQLDRNTHNVITVEDPIEANLPEVSQIEINKKAGITFASALRSILRQAADVICVGEIRDEETAEIALRAAQTGHLVLATIHCSSNAMAVLRLLDLGVSPLLLASGLSLLVSQRLLRKLCPRCRKLAEPAPSLVAEWQQAGLSGGQVFQPVGCDYCGGTGYQGRTAIADLLVVTDQLRAELPRDSTVATRLRAEGEQQGRRNLKSEGLRLVCAGITSLEEVERVVG